MSLDFDKHFEETTRQVDRVQKIAWAGIIIVFAIQLSVFFGVATLIVLGIRWLLQNT